MDGERSVDGFIDKLRDWRIVTSKSNLKRERSETMPKREIINIGPKPIAPYSQGVKIGDLVYTSGQIGQDPSTWKIVVGGIKAETHQIFENAKTILEAGGSSLDKTIKTLVFLVDMEKDYAGMNEVYSKYFKPDPPARSTVQVSKLAMGALVEIEFIATI